MTQPAAVSDADRTELPRKKRVNAKRTIFVIILLAVVTWIVNYVLVSQPIGTKLKADERNRSFTLSAHYQYFVVPSTLVLDLRRVDDSSPLDLFRGLFQAAEAMHEADRHFDYVLLARSGVSVYRIKGDDFENLGRSFAVGENPLYLVRTLPEQLYTPEGVAAFGTWTGGTIAVVGKQLEEITEAGRTWATGKQR